MWYAIATARLLSTGVANLATSEAGAPSSTWSYSTAMRHSTPSMPMPSPTGVVDRLVTVESWISPAARSAPVSHSGVSSAGDVGYGRVLMGSLLGIDLPRGRRTSCQRKGSSAPATLSTAPASATVVVHRRPRRELHLAGDRGYVPG